MKKEEISTEGIDDFLEEVSVEISSVSLINLKLTPFFQRGPGNILIVRNGLFPLKVYLDLNKTPIDPLTFEEQWPRYREEIYRRVVLKQVEFGLIYLKKSDLENLQIQLDRRLEK